MQGSDWYRLIFFQYLGLGIDTGSILKQEVNHLGITIVTGYDERSVSQLEREK